MSAVKLGCQTITWGEGQKNDFAAVFKATAAAGYTGVEIGFRHIQQTPPHKLKQLLDAAKLTLIATHIGGNLENTDQAAGERDILAQVLEYLQAIGTPRLMYSGLKYENDAQFERDLQILSRTVEQCQSAGIELLYHNHDWEFADNSRVYNALVERTQVGFCPDIGWVMRGGVDVLKLLDRIKNRLGAIHFKDFPTRHAAATQVNPVLLGQGVAPLAEAAQWAIKNRPDIWMIAEQDKADLAAAQAIETNNYYLREIFDLR